MSWIHNPISKSKNILLFRTSRRKYSSTTSNEPVKTASKQKLSLQPPRGMPDIYGLEQQKRSQIVDACKRVAKSYAFEEISTPIVEDHNVFSRTLGTDSDVVSKEMYTFSDKSDHILSLRPEGTAGIVRAVINNPNEIGNQLFYYGPMFRYERPQKGRTRQFHQFGVEQFKSSQPFSDIQIIEMAHVLLKRELKINNFRLEINSLGDEESRLSYRQVLENYLNKHKDQLSPLSKQRLERGSIMRILDSKEEQDQIIITNAPSLLDHLNVASSTRFEKVLNGLNTIGVDYKVNPRLVRGLDYYNDTCFEFVTTDSTTTLENAAKSDKNDKSNSVVVGQAILAGGRYDRLAEIMGGKPTPGIGWAAGIERLSSLYFNSVQTFKKDLTAIIPVTDSEDMDEIWAASLKLAQTLRSAGLSIFFSYENSVAKRTKKASQASCGYAIFLGSNEIQREVLIVKDLETGVQEEMTVHKFIDKIKSFGI